MRSLYLEAEIKEKSMRGKASSYHLDPPEDLGAEGANSVTSFMQSAVHTCAAWKCLLARVQSYPD
jgi:hypothetical protein